MKNYLAVDIGAESGRIILGSVSDDSFTLKEIYRFPNGMLNIGGKFHWNIAQVYKEILTGLEYCAAVEKVIPESIGIDTWGVDYGLLAGDGTMLGLPFTYRDARTEGAVEAFTKILPAKDLYHLTGTLMASYNTIFQVFASKRTQPGIWDAAADLLFIPDLLAYFLTGNKRTEHSFATTSQLYNPIKKEWEAQLLGILGISPGLMQEVVAPESVIGYLDERICRQTGMKRVPVVAVLTHDTNSAVTAIPAVGNNWAFISSGTWSLMGFEHDKPLINDETFRLNFTNEGGLRNTWHILKNHTGLWLLQECRRAWKSENYSYDRLETLAGEAQPFMSFIDTDHPGFLNPPDMPSAILGYLEQTRQQLPQTHGQFARIILESLALKYRQTMEEIESLKGSPVEELFITGGGVQNELLCRLTANATGKITRTALAEGTAAGNILIQALAMGQFQTTDEIRNLVKRSFPSKTFLPGDT